MNGRKEWKDLMFVIKAWLLCMPMFLLNLSIGFYGRRNAVGIFLFMFFSTLANSDTPVQ